MNPDPPPSDAPAQRRLRLRWIGLTLGLALIALAIFTLVRQQELLQDAWRALRDPSPLHLALLFGGIIANMILSGIVYRLLMMRYGQVGWLEMQAVIASATLVNFLPLRPGLVGRIAYHRSVNRIPAIDSARAVVTALLCSVIVGSCLMTAVFVSAATDVPLWISTLAPLIVIALLTIPIRGWRFEIAALAVRYLEVAIWALRIWCAFALIGRPIDAGAALALACVSIIATMVPFVSNGLGLREWAVGLVAPLLADTALLPGHGLAAELVHRVAELVVVAVIGSVATLWLVRHVRARTSAS